MDAEAVARFGRPDEVVVGDPEAAVEAVVVGDDAVGELDGGDSLLRRGALDLLPVLVGAGEKEDIESPRRW